MRVHVLLFANLRQRAGQGELALDVPEPATVRSVADLLEERLERFDLGGVMCAVNQRYVDAGTALAEGDTVAFLPPVSGG